MMRNSQVPEKVKGWTNFWRFQRKREKESQTMGDLGNNQGHKLLFHAGLCFLYYSCLFEDIKLNMFSVEHSDSTDHVYTEHACLSEASGVATCCQHL